jgi:glycosyltransferase involved in cell wall biosynthesis
MRDEALRVSVVIPCYNRASVIARAVKSALAQTHADLEVVVVDDGSEDAVSLAAVLKEFDAQRVRLVRHLTNRNGAAARNTGVRESRGELIAFLDSDDEWAVDKLELQVGRFEDLEEPQAVIYCRSVVVTEATGNSEGAIWPQRSIGRNERMGDYLFLNRGFLQTSSILMSRELALATPFNEQLRRHQDYDLLLRLEAQGCVFSMVEKPLVTVHWEEMQSTARGLNPAKSLEFVSSYRQYLSARAVSGFVLQQVVFRLLRARCRREGLAALRHHVRFKHMRLVDWILLISLLLFADDRVAKFFVAARNSLRSSFVKADCTSTPAL